MISVQPGVSVGVIIVSFAVVIIGGLGSIEGAAIGALIVGLARSLAVHIAPVAELFSIYIVMALVLMFRPEGLFQRIQAQKDLSMAATIAAPPCRAPRPQPRRRASRWPGWPSRPCWRWPGCSCPSG